jgi:hypothetical protein
VKRLGIIKEEALAEVRFMFRTPPATYRAIKAALFMLGKEANTFNNWTKCRAYLTTKLFEDFEGFEATADRVMPHWKGVRACVKGLKPAALQGEAILGEMLRVYIEHTKIVAKAASAVRKEQAALELAQEKQAVEQAALDEVQKILDEAEERFRIANPPPVEPAEGEAGEGGEEGAEGEEGEGGEEE